MSTLTSASARVRNSDAATPGRSGTPDTVIFDSDVSWVTAEMMAFSMEASSVTHVPGAHVKALRTCSFTP